MPAEMAIDSLSDSLPEVVFRRKNIALFKKLAKKTHFNLREVEGYTAKKSILLVFLYFFCLFNFYRFIIDFIVALAVIHKKITQTLGPMTRSVFRDVMHSALDFTENIRHLYIDRIFGAFDKNNVLQV